MVWGEELRGPPGLGAPKKDMMLPFCLVFLASEEPLGWEEPALRLREDIVLDVGCGGEGGLLVKLRLRCWKRVESR